MGLRAIGRARRRRAAVRQRHRHEVKIPYERVWKPIDGILRQRNYDHPIRRLRSPGETERAPATSRGPSDRSAELGPSDLEMLATSAYMLGREQEYREVLERATGPISSSAVWDEAQANFLLHCLMAIFFLAGSSLCFFFAFLMHFFSCTGLPVGAA